MITWRIYGTVNSALGLGRGWKRLGVLNSFRKGFPSTDRFAVIRILTDLSIQSILIDGFGQRRSAQLLRLLAWDSLFDLLTFDARYPRRSLRSNPLYESFVVNLLLPVSCSVIITIFFSDALSLPGFDLNLLLFFASLFLVPFFVLFVVVLHSFLPSSLPFLYLSLSLLSSTRRSCSSLPRVSPHHLIYQQIFYSPSPSLYLTHYDPPYRPRPFSPHPHPCSPSHLLFPIPTRSRGLLRFLEVPILPSLSLRHPTRRTNHQTVDRIEFRRRRNCRTRHFCLLLR